jgi:hypothetical protein
VRKQLGTLFGLREAELRKGNDSLPTNDGSNGLLLPKGTSLVHGRIVESGFSGQPDSDDVAVGQRPIRTAGSGCPWRRAKGNRLFDSRESLVESNDVGPEIFAVGPSAPVGTVRLELVVSPIAVVVLNKNRVRIGREKVTRWPRSWRKG